MSRALYIGRFQPPHKGHAEVIRHMAERHDEIVICIGSAYQSHTTVNPFTAGERIEMLRALTLDIAPSTYFYFIPVPDVHRYNIWVQHILSLIPQVDVVYTNNPLIKRLFRDFSSLTVEGTPVFSRREFSGTEVRKRMLRKENWQDLIHRSVIKILVDLNAAERVREVSRDDTQGESEEGG